MSAEKPQRRTLESLTNKELVWHHYLEQWLLFEAGFDIDLDAEFRDQLMKRMRDSRTAIGKWARQYHQALDRVLREKATVAISRGEG